MGLLVPELAARWAAARPLFALLAEAAAFFGLGAVMGSFRPERPWRWAVAAVVPAAVKSLVVSVLPGTPGGALLFLLMSLPNLVLLGFTTLAGACLAAFALARPQPPSAPAVRDPSFTTSFTWIVVWSAALGSAGFAAGFYGPLILQPDANQGPLLGIVITGPLGAVAGAALGAILSAVRRWWSPRMGIWIAVSCILYVAGILAYTASGG